MSTVSQLCAINLFLIAIIVGVRSAFPPSLRYPLPVSVNKITEIGVSCDSGFINASVALQYPFKGVLFAKDFSQECKILGDMSNSLSITLPTSGCGVRLSTRTSKNGITEMFYSVVIVAQQDRHLRQIADQEKYLECLVNEETFTVESPPMAEVLKKGKSLRRTGRMKDDDGKDAEAARAWMEITPEDGDARPESGLQVGDSALLTIKATLPAGIGWKVIECVAHDGLGDSSQKLLDEDGCPIDELLLPIPELGPIRSISLMRHQEAIARFAAFKFPDRDRLHLSCGLELCRGTCPNVDCHWSNRTDENRLGRNLADAGENGEILDRLKVYNSVEVLAPAIDDLRKSERLQQIGDPSSSSIYPFANLPGDRTFCVSPDKLAVTFCVLGAIFLCAVIVAACALLRARRGGHDGPFYTTRSLFSSGSSSGGGSFGSKLLLHDSPCMGDPSGAGAMHYGRIL